MAAVVAEEALPTLAVVQTIPDRLPLAQAPTICLMGVIDSLPGSLDQSRL